MSRIAEGVLCSFALALSSSAALAQTPAPEQPAAPKSVQGETSDRTPEKATPTPLPQKDTAGGETSDRTPEHHTPGTGAGTGTSGSGTTGTTGGGDASGSGNSGSTGSGTSKMPAQPQ